MADPTLVLISDLKVLGEQVERICDVIPNLKFRILSDLDSALLDDDWQDVSLVLIHQVDPRSLIRVDRLLRKVAAARRPIATVVLGDPFVADHATATLRMGAADYLGLPLNLSRLSQVIGALTLQDRKAVGMAKGGSGCAEEPIFEGDSPQVCLLVDQLRRVAPGGATILLGGEVGTGKTRLARRIHELSDRRAEPFEVINCGELLGLKGEAELFGQALGAERRPGRLAEVGGGTLFLDGVEALLPTLQAKLLKVIEDRVFEPIGDAEPVPFRARVIAASQRPLDEEVAEGRFRSDLYFRLNVVGFELPPLRERGSAIASLSHQFLIEFADREGSGIELVSAGALKVLQEHDWPGNVRELRNVMARCVATCPDRSIRREDLPSSVLDGSFRINPISNPASSSQFSTFNWSSLAETRGQVELARITQALEKHSNNRLRAAGELGISRMTLYKKLHKYGLIHSSPSPSPPGMV